MFHRCQNQKEAKKLFRKLALRLHPDCGGDQDLMVLLQESYDLFETSFSEEKIFTKKKPNLYEKSVENIPYGDERLGIIGEIYEYAQENDHFDTKFFDSICRFLAEKGYITSNQYNSLLRMYYGFEMHKRKKA